MNGKEILTHDESISYLAATCHQGEYQAMIDRRSAPIGRWVRAAAWQRYLRIERRGCFATIGRDLAHTDIHPPAYFWLLHLWMLVFGTGVAAGARLDALIDLATMLALFGLARDTLRSAGWAAAVAATWALSPAAVTIGAEARPYGLFALCTVLLFWACSRTLDQGTGVFRWSAIAAATAAGLLTHFEFLIVIAGAGLLAGWAVLRGERRAFTSVATALAAGILVAIAAHPGFLESFVRQGRQSDGLATVGLSLRVARMMRGTANLLLPGPWFTTAMAVVLVTILVALAGWLVKRAIEARRIRELRVLLAFAWIWGAICAAYLLGFSHGGAMGGKYLASAWPFAAFVPVLVLRELPSIRPAVALAGIPMLVAAGLAAGVMWQPERSTTVKEPTAVVIDQVHRGHLLRALLGLSPRTPVFAAEQRTLLERNGWETGLRAGAVYISARGYENSLEATRDILARATTLTQATRPTDFYDIGIAFRLRPAACDASACGDRRRPAPRDPTTARHRHGAGRGG